MDKEETETARLRKLIYKAIYVHGRDQDLGKAKPCSPIPSPNPNIEPHANNAGMCQGPSLEGGPQRDYFACLDFGDGAKQEMRKQKCNREQSDRREGRILPKHKSESTRRSVYMAQS